MNKPIKILYVNGGLMDRGGVTSVMMSYYLGFDANKIHIDFLVHGSGTGDRDHEILSKGGKIFRVPPKSKKPIENYLLVKKILNQGNYDIVHSHADAGNAYILKIAKMCNVPVRISHCHNTDYTITNRFRIMLNNMQKKMIKKYATHLWACSKQAAEWLYGTSEGVQIMHNAISVKKYQYSAENRVNIRKKYNIEDAYVLIMVGRLDYQKNHRFMLEVIKEVVKEVPTLKLLVVGDGKLRDDLVHIVNELKLNNCVIFCGQIKNVNEYYSAADLFVMPSLFEGLPVSAVEAQASGLRCLISTHVTKEVKVTDDVEYLSIDDISTWIERIIALKNCVRNISESHLKVVASGYEICDQINRMQDQYIEMVQKNENFIYK